MQRRKFASKEPKPEKKWTPDGDMWPQRPVPSPHPPKKAPMTHSTSESVITHPLCHFRAQKRKHSDGYMHTRDRTQSFIILFRAAISISSALSAPTWTVPAVGQTSPPPPPPRTHLCLSSTSRHRLLFTPACALYSLSRATARTGAPLYLPAKWK